MSGPPVTGSHAFDEGRFEAVLGRLRRIDPVLAEDLARLAAEAHAGLDHSRWVELRPRSQFNPERLVERARQRQPTSVIWAEFIRNIIVLVPIIVTWRALGAATEAYGRCNVDAAASSAIAGASFISLWQEGFATCLNASAHYQLPDSFLSFPGLVTWDVGLLLIVLAGTIVTQAYATVWRQYRVEPKALRLGYEIQPFVEHLANHVDEFRDLEERVDEKALRRAIQNLPEDLRSTGANVRTSATELEREVANLGGQLGLLVTVVTRLEETFRSTSNEIHSTAQDHAKAAAALETAGTTLSEVAARQTELIASTRRLQSDASTIANELAELSRQGGAGLSGLAGVAAEARNTMVDVVSAAFALRTASDGLRGELGLFTTNTKAMGAELNTAVTLLREAAVAQAETVRELGAAAAAIEDSANKHAMVVGEAAPIRDAAHQAAEAVRELRDAIRGLKPVLAPSPLTALLALVTGVVRDAAHQAAEAARELRDAVRGLKPVLSPSPPRRLFVLAAGAAGVALLAVAIVLWLGR